MSVLFDILKGVGNAADLPGSSVRDILARRNPLDQWMTPFGDQNRATGRDVLRTYGMASEQDTGMNAAGGMATEMALDPLSWLGAGALFKALRGAGKAAGAVGTAGRAVQRTGLQQALARSARPATAMSIASPVAGAYLMGDNKEGAGWKNAVGMGLMAAPLVFGMAKGAKGLSSRAASKNLPQQFTSLRSVKDEAGQWVDQIKHVDPLQSDELKDSISAWQTAGGSAKTHKFTRDVQIARGEIAATTEERTAAAMRVMQAFPSHHTWDRRASKLQVTAPLLAAGSGAVARASQDRREEGV